MIYRDLKAQANEDTSVEVTLRTFALKRKLIYLGKIYLSTPEVNLSSVSFCLGEKVTLKKITSRYLQVDRIKFYAVQTWFWLANRKQHARKSHRSKRNGSPSLLFLRCCKQARRSQIKWFFFSAWLLDEPKEEDKLRYFMYLLLLLCRNVGLA